jgi:hypothetical protein
MTTTTPSSAPAASAPGCFWYFIALVVAIAGWVGMGLILFSGISSMAGQMKRVLVPGQAELKLDKPGTYTIFHEHQSTMNGRVYNVENVSGLQITVRALPGGTVVPLTRGASSNYSYSGHAGRSLFNFEVRQPGTYQIIGAYSDGRKEPQTVLAISSGFLGGLIGTILGALAMAFGGMGLAIAIFVIVFIKRRRARQAAAHA